MSATRSLAATATLACLCACDFGGDPGPGGSGTSIPSSVTWMSTTLAGGSTAGKASAAPGTSEASYLLDTLPDPGGDLYLSYRITPSNLEGRLIQAALMVGVPGAGKGASALHIVGGENGFLGASVENSGELPLVNLGERLTVGNGFKCCWSTYPADEDAYSGWFEIMFAFADVTFPVHGGALEGTHTVRTAFADVDDKGYRKGDLLYRTDAGWRWVDSATGELRESRPEKPLQLGWVAEFDGSGDGRGNQHIPTMFVSISDSQKVHMPADTVLANAWEFIVDFNLRQGLIFRRMDPDSMTTVAQLVSHFDIRADRDNASSGSDGIGSNFYAIKTPLEVQRPNDFKDSLDNWILPPPEDSPDA